MLANGGVSFVLFEQMHGRDVLFGIWVPMCRTRVHQGKNRGADAAARSSIWTSIGVVFWSFSLPGAFSKAASPKCAATKVLSVFVQVFFPFLGQPTFEKVFKSP